MCGRQIAYAKSCFGSRLKTNVRKGKKEPSKWFVLFTVAAVAIVRVFVQYFGCRCAFRLYHVDKNKTKKGTRRKRELVKANVVGAILSTLSLNIHGEAIAFTLPAAVLGYCNKFLFSSLQALSLSLFRPALTQWHGRWMLHDGEKRVYKWATCGKVGRNKSLSFSLPLAQQNTVPRVLHRNSCSPADCGCFVFIIFFIYIFYARGF